MSGYGSLFSAAGDLFGGFMGAQAAGASAQAYGQAAAITTQMTGIKELAANRQIFQTIGAGAAQAAGNGLTMSGSTAALMRSSAA